MRDYTIFIPEYIAAGAAIGIIGVELFCMDDGWFGGLSGQIRF